MSHRPSSDDKSIDAFSLNRFLVNKLLFDRSLMWVRLKSPRLIFWKHLTLFCCSERLRLITMNVKQWRFKQAFDVRVCLDVNWFSTTKRDQLSVLMSFDRLLSWFRKLVQSTMKRQNENCFLRKKISKQPSVQNCSRSSSSWELLLMERRLGFF